MSPERPPSQDSGGGGGCGGSISVVTKTFDSTNMVLSTIPPIESGHMIIQQHQQQQQQQHHRITATTNTHQITNGINNYTQLHGHSPTSIITKPVISPTNGSPSKYVFLQQNGNGQHIGSEPGTTTTTTYITGSQTNNVGNIVLVTTTESMEINSAGEQISSHNGNGTDEELTSLTWLQDKNLIKGIVACTNKSAAASPARQSSNSGALSPTSDFLEDSCVSEDNASSANSNSDQGISIHNAEYSPNGQNGTSFVVHRHHLQTNQFSQAQNNSSPIQYTNNNNSISKNRNLILSSPSTHTALSSQAGGGAAITNGGNSFLTNATVPDHLVGATTTVHVGPSGTTTVVEYKAGSNFISSPRNHCIPQVPSSPRRTPPVVNSVLVTSPTISAPPTPPPISNSSSTSAHQHFHKKYIREQLNGCEQTTIQNGGGQYFSSNNLNNTIAPFSPNHSISSFPADSKEFIHSTPMKQQTTPLYTTINGHEPVIKEESSFEYPSEKVQNIQKPITSPKQKHPTNVPYNPLVHTHNKPPYSFSSLIFMAIEDSPEKALPVKEIYAWIVQHFPYYKTAPTGWKNSVRHNLSLNKSFLKVEKAPNMGKGSLWRVEHSQRPNLIQALTRSPFFPGSVVDKIAPLKSPATPQPFESPPSTPTKSTLDARLFPKLSKMIKEMVTKGTDHDIEADSSEMYKVSYSTNGNVTVNGSNLNGNDCVNNGGAGGGSGGGGDDDDGGTPHYDNIERLTRDCGADSIDDVNAATAMLALKHGPKVFNETFPNGSPVITSSPSEDHTYSAGGGGGGGGSSTNSGGRSQNGSDINSNGASSDAAYESSEENPIHEITPQEIEERRRHIEGVDALLSFASKVSSMSSSGTSSPVKRPAVDDDHISSYKESNSNSLTNSASEDDNINIHRQQQQLLFTPQGFYSSSHVLSSPSPAKKLKTPRNLRNKIKRKSAWIR